MASAASDPPNLRIGDAQRDAAVEVLRAHFAAGRLSVDEFDDRMGRALSATTAADLEPLFADLPRDPEAVAGQSLWRAPTPSRPRTSWARTAQRWMMVLAPVLFLLVFTGLPHWWIAYVIWGVLFAVLNRAERALEAGEAPKALPPGSTGA